MSEHWQVSRSRVVEAPPEVVFDFIARPANHHRLDGSDHVRTPRDPDQRLTAVGDHFTMRMRWGLPYVVGNVVVEFEEGRRIAWRHFAGHRWRWELAPAEAGTRVTETFDASRAPGRRSYPRLFGFPTRYGRILEESLRRLAGAITEDGTSA